MASLVNNEEKSRNFSLNETQHPIKIIRPNQSLDKLRNLGDFSPQKSRILHLPKIMMKNIQPLNQFLGMAEKEGKSPIKNSRYI